MTVRKAIKASLGLLSRRDRRLLGVSVLIQMTTSLLDLIGVLLLGLVGALAVTVVQSQPAPALVLTVADFLGLGTLSGQQLVVIFAGSAAVVLLTKSIASAFLTRRVLVFLANRQALVSARLTKELLQRPLTFLQQRSSQETAFALIQGAGHATIQILGQTVIAVTEITLLIVLAIALLFLDPLVTLAAIAFFAVVGLGLQKAMGGWASRVGKEWAKADIASLNSVQEALTAYREVSVSNRRSLYVDRIQQLRWQAAKVAADITFIQLVPKYVFEAALVLGGFALASILFFTQDSVSAVGTLALFLAAGSRVMPALLRLQTSTLTLRSAAGNATPTFELASDLDHPLEVLQRPESAEHLKDVIARGHEALSASVDLTAVSFAYPGSVRPAIDTVTLHVDPGSSLALAGSSGAGKSTLADLILGVLQPDSGSISIGGVGPTEAVVKWPGAIAYVPQDVMLANSTVRENVALGLPVEAIDDEFVWEALGRAHLAAFLKSKREGLDTYVGESGIKLSGGQRQRLGIARALYSRPKLLVLDEATSALDAETEAAISKTIQELEGEVTTVIIAHRLSTVRNVDQMLYLQDGNSVALGCFADVRRTVPALDRQAQLLGL